MIEEKEEAGVGPAGIAANDRGDDPGDGRDFPDEGAPASPEERLAAVEAELADTKDRLLRALAETENVRHRFQREREDAQKYAISGFAKDLLTAVDNLRRALGALARGGGGGAEGTSRLGGGAGAHRAPRSAGGGRGVER